MHRLGRDPRRGDAHPRHRIRPRNLRGRPGNLPPARGRDVQHSVRRRHDGGGDIRAASLFNSRVRRADPLRSRRQRGAARVRRVVRRVRVRAIERWSELRVRADGAREPGARSAEAPRVRASRFVQASVVNVVRIVHLSLSPAAGRTRGGIQRGVRPQLEQGRAHPRAQHRRRVPEPAVQPQRERPVRRPRSGPKIKRRKRRHQLALRDAPRPRPEAQHRARAPRGGFDDPAGAPAAGSARVQPFQDRVDPRGGRAASRVVRLE